MGLPDLRHFRLADTGDGCWIIPDYRDRLAAWGLLEPADVAARLADPGVSFDERRTAVRFLGFDDESLFLKFYIRPSLARRLRSRLRRRGTAMWHELQMLDRLAAASIRTPVPVAVGQVPIGHRFETYLLMTAITDHVSLEQIMFGSAPEMLDDFDRRARATRLIAELVRRMHGGGVLNPTLYTRHVYLRPEAATLDDLATLDAEQARLGRANDRAIARDLAALRLTCTDKLRATDCMRFLKAYLGGKADRPAVKRMWRRCGAVARAKRSQRRFKQYQGDGLRS